MKKILFIITLLVSVTAFSQTRGFFSTPYLISFDVSTKTMDIQNGSSLGGAYVMNKFVITKTSNSQKLLDCYDGLIFVFPDTLTNADITQIGTSGVQRINIHNNQIATGNIQNVLIKDILLQFTNTSYSVTSNNGHYPFVITNISTGVATVTIYPQGVMLFADITTVTASSFTANIKKIILP